MHWIKIGDEKWSKVISTPDFLTLNFSTPDFSTPDFSNPGFSGLFNPKSRVETSGIGKFLVEKSWVGMSGVEMPFNHEQFVPLHVLGCTDL